MNIEDPTEYWQLLGLLLLALVAIAWLYIWLRKRPDPDELERQRREWIDSVGKIADATIVEVQAQLISYSYFARGIEYFASQDVSALEARLPADQWEVIGPASVKYDPRNPANSIILTEQWTGLRKSSHSNSKAN